MKSWTCPLFSFDYLQIRRELFWRGSPDGVDDRSDGPPLPLHRLSILFQTPHWHSLSNESCFLRKDRNSRTRGDGQSCKDNVFHPCSSCWIHLQRSHHCWKHTCPSHSFHPPPSLRRTWSHHCTALFRILLSCQPSSLPSTEIHRGTNNCLCHASLPLCTHPRTHPYLGSASFHSHEAQTEYSSHLHSWIPLK